MDLQQFLREATLEPRDALKGIEEQLQVARRQQVAADDRQKRIGSEIKTLKRDHSKKKQEQAAMDTNIEEINSSIDDLEEQLRDCKSKLMEETEKRDDVFQNLRHLDDKLKHLNREAEREVVIRAKSIKEEQRCLEQLDAVRARLRDARFRGYSEFNKSLWSSITEHMLSLADRHQKIQAYNVMNQERHSKPEVAHLCEAREEWTKILRTVSVPSVKEAAEQELLRVDEKLNEMYPGALEITEPPDLQEIHLDIYYTCLTNDVVEIVLPIPSDQWNQVDHNVQLGESELLLKLVWGLAEYLGADPKESEFELFNGLTLLRTKSNIAKSTNLTFSLSNGTTVAVVLGQLPSEVEEVLSHERRTA